MLCSSERIQLASIQQQINPAETGAGPVAPVDAGLRGLRPANQKVASINFLGRYLVLVGLTPPALFGIAVGATNIVVKSADSSAQIAGIAIVWSASTIVSLAAVFVGLRVAAIYRHRVPELPDSGTVENEVSAGESHVSGELPAGRYQSLKSIQRDDDLPR